MIKHKKNEKVTNFSKEFETKHTFTNIRFECGVT